MVWYGIIFVGDEIALPRKGGVKVNKEEMLFVAAIIGSYTASVAAASATLSFHLKWLEWKEERKPYRRLKQARKNARKRKRPAKRRNRWQVGQGQAGRLVYRCPVCRSYILLYSNFIPFIPKSKARGLYADVGLLVNHCRFYPGSCYMYLYPCYCPKTLLAAPARKKAESSSRSF